MLEDLLKVGSDASWLPTAEGGKQGTGGECSLGAMDVKGGKYLPFVANGINYVESQGKDVISGKFTGCIMAAYNVKGGSRRVCHVSTGNGQDCKSKWEEIKAASSSVTEFKPSDSIDVSKFGGGMSLYGCYGIITAEGKCFAVVAGVLKNKVTVVDLKLVKK